MLSIILPMKSLGKHKIVEIAIFVVVSIIDSMSKLNMNIIYDTILRKIQLN